MIQKVKLGKQGLLVPQQGLGCMGLTPIGAANVYGVADEGEAIATIRRAEELGINMLDTADVYGPFLNERLIAKAIEGKRSDYIIASKFGFEIGDDGAFTGQFNGKPEYVRKSVERSLSNLKTDFIDLYYLHRSDPSIPIEESIGAMGQLVQEGKIGYVGVSQLSPSALRLAHATHPISAVQSEYSLFDRTPEEDGILETTQELGIGFVAYSPLGRGFLTGEIKSPNDFDEDDFRRFWPRYSGDNFYKNLELVQGIKAMAVQKGISSAQLAIAWVLAQGVVTIPGTKRCSFLEANAAASLVKLSQADLKQLDDLAPVGSTVGAAYPS